MGKRYGVIVVDPPWSYRNQQEGAAVNHYPTMTNSEILALPVEELAATDAVLFLWATWPNLPIAMSLFEPWGFDYVTGLPWVKTTEPPTLDLWGELHARPSFGIGYWLRGCSEPILIGKRGNAKAPEMPYLGLLGERMEHSRKPDSIHEIAEGLPGPRLELFARRQRPGWDVWGNEIPSTAEMVAKAAAGQREA